MSIQSQNQLPHSPNVQYYQAPALFGNKGIPRSEYPIVLGLIVVALIIGAFIGANLIDDYVYADRKKAAAVDAALAQVERQPLPILNDHRGQGSGDLRASLEQAGMKFVDNPVQLPEGSNVDALDIDKIPTTVEQADIDIALANGIDKLPSEKAAAYLADYWNLTLNRTDVSDLKVKYCLFGPATIEQAIVQAVETQGWQNSSLGESGVDQIGNTYQHGSIDLDGKTYRWSVYACPLSEVYSILGLPASSWYISARLTG